MRQAVASALKHDWGYLCIKNSGYGTAVETDQEFGGIGVLGGESPPLEVLTRTRKPSLGQHREVLSEGDVESRETHRRFGRPKC